MPIRTDRLKAQYQLVRDSLEGEDAIRAQGQLYVPKPDGMSVENYHHYLDRACWYGAPEATLRALVGIALRKDPVIKLPDRLEPMRLNATHENAPITNLIEETVREVTAMGRFGILVDLPASGNSVNTVPHLSTFKAESIENFETAYVDGRRVLTKVHLASDEQFDGSDVFYELSLEGGAVYTFRRFIRDQHENRVDVGEEIVPTFGGRTLNYIPFILVSHEGNKPEHVTPPLLALCRVALSHFKNSADREHAIFLTSSPTPWIAGSLPQNKVPQTLGSGALWLLPEGATCGMLEFSGAGVQAQRELMEEKVATMATLGARLVNTQINRNEQPEVAAARTRSELSLLHGVVINAQDAINWLLRIAAEWMGADPDEVQVTLSKDMIEATMDPRMIEAQMRAWQSGLLSRATVYENFQNGEIARSDRSLEEETTLIEAEGGDLSSPIIGALAG